MLHVQQSVVHTYQPCYDLRRAVGNEGMSSFCLRRSRARPCSLWWGVIVLTAWGAPGVSIASALSYSEVQYTGLEALYNATGGERWNSSAGWRDAALGVCGWYGVTCDSSGHNVTGIALASNSLSGDLSEAEELFEIVSLENVDLSNNALVGPVALGLGKMPRLEVLDLSRNVLSYFPTSWGSEASSLKHLMLQHNNISG